MYWVKYCTSNKFIVQCNLVGMAVWMKYKTTEHLGV